MIKFISSQQTLILRSEILRNNLPLSACVFTTDEVENAFHLGCFDGKELLAIASFFPNNKPKIIGLGYQLRGMATAAQHVGKGYGKQLISFAVTHLKNKEVNYIWCNARKTATPFYLKNGFKFCSSEFEVNGIGPHYEMILNY